MHSEIASHLAQEDRLAAYFEARPGQIVTHDALVAEVGENYRSRISPLRKRGMHIENVPTFKADGTRGYGSYKYLPYVPQGRDAGTWVDITAPLPLLPDAHPGPYQR